MAAARRSDIVIVGAGPASLFSVFQLGLYGLSCHLVEALDRAGGQCAAFYPDKPIFDVPGFAQIMGDELVARLEAQIAPHAPSFHFGQMVTDIRPAENGFSVTTDKGALFEAPAVVIASGLGAFDRAGQIVRPDPLAGLPVRREGNAIAVAPDTFATSMPGIHAIGDACHYPGKLKLILSGFHEAALMTQAVRRRLL